MHQQTLAGEREVAELAASLLAASLPQHQAAASSLGASSRSLLEGSVGATRTSTMDTSIEGEGCDELANLDARASSLLEHCRQLLSAPPTDDAEQVRVTMMSAVLAFEQAIILVPVISYDILVRLVS